MKKYIFLISILTTFLNATTIYNGKCVETFKPIASAEPYIVLTYSNPQQGVENVPYSQELINSLVSNDGKFIYKTIGTMMTRCHYATSNNILGLPETEYNFLLAIYGIFLSSLIAFGLIKAF